MVLAAMNEEKLQTDQVITQFASVLNAAHLLAEETDQRLHDLASRYPDAFSPEIRQQDLTLPSQQDDALTD